MKFYLRNFVLLIAIAFVSIVVWFYFTSYYSISLSTNSKPVASGLVSAATDTDLDASDRSRPVLNATSAESSQLGKVRNIVCNINGESKINCIKLLSGKETSIYVPFSFIHKHFEINGKIVHSKNQEYFEWSHSYSKVFYPDEPYNSAGKFLWFENYNVEARERVKVK